MSQIWTLLEDGRHHCELHNETFGSLDQCPGCPPPNLDPTAIAVIDASGDDPLPPPPDGCRTAEEHEREFTALAEYATALAHEVADGKPAEGKKRARKSNPQLAVKIMAEATKARRAASALARAREDDELLRRLDKRKAERDRGRH